MGDSRGCYGKETNSAKASQSRNILGGTNHMSKGQLAWRCMAFLGNHPESLVACEWVSKLSTKQCGWKGGMESSYEGLCTSGHQGMSWWHLTYRRIQTISTSDSTSGLPLSNPLKLPDSTAPPSWSFPCQEASPASPILLPQGNIWLTLTVSCTIVHFRYSSVLWKMAWNSPWRV